MKYVLLGALFFALAPSQASAGGAFACADACSRDPRNGTSCLDLGLGCNAITRICTVCSNDQHCMPGGICDNGTCLGVVCIYDAGPDAGDTGGADVDPADGGDAVPMDAEPADADVADAQPEDADPIDVAFPDARAPTDPIGGPRGTSSEKDPFEEDKCGCTTTARRGSSAWILIVMLMFAQRWWRRGGSGPGGAVVI